MTSRKLESITHTHQLVSIVEDYLYGEPLDLIRARLQYEANENHKRTKILFEAIKLNEIPGKNDNNKETDYVTKILEALAIQKDEKIDRVLDETDNLYALIYNLYHCGYKHLGDLLTHIHDTRPKRMWALFFMLGAILSAGLGVFFYYKNDYFEAVYHWLEKTFPKVTEWAIKTFTSIKNIPLVGIIPNGISLIWVWYHTITNPLYKTSDKINHLFFKSAATAMVITAYVLSFNAAGLMPLAAALLFIGAECINLVRSSYHLYKNLRASETPTYPKTQKDWNSLSSYYRAQCEYKRARSTFIADVIAACCTTTAIMLWCFLPPSLLITVFSLSFIVMVDLAKYFRVEQVKSNTANTLQKKLEQLHIDTIKSQSSQPTAPRASLSYDGVSNDRADTPHSPHRRSTNSRFFQSASSSSSSPTPQQQAHASAFRRATSTATS